MLKLKSCPKCKEGAVTFDRDQHGWYAYRIQCGYMRDLVSISELEQQPAVDVREGRTRVRISGKGK